MDVDLGKIISEKLREALAARGRANLVIAGRSGVGKSTLVNAVFQGDIAKVGQGRPVSMNIQEYTKEGIPLSIFDTRGLEMDEYEETLAQLKGLFSERSAREDPKDHLHVAWICISEESRRVESGESKVAALLAEYGIPVVAVITKARSDGGFREEVRRLIPQARQVMRVRALGDIDDDGHETKPKGLEDLVEATLELVPEGQKNAFVAAQKVSLRAKKTRAHAVVVASALSAAAIGAAPIPFSDFFLLAPMQVGMLAGITAVWGLPLSQAFLVTLVSSAAGTVGATLAGQSIIASILKFFPGLGTLAGGAISAATAATLTTILGEAYVAALAAIFQADPNAQPTAEAVASAFNAELNKRR